MIVYKEMKQTKILSKKNISNIELSSNFWKYLPKTRARREIMLSRHMLKSSFCWREQVISKSRKPMKGLIGKKSKIRTVSKHIIISNLSQERGREDF